MKKFKKFAACALAILLAASCASPMAAQAATKQAQGAFFAKKSLTLRVGEQETAPLKAKYAKLAKKMKWKSSNEKVATVSKTGAVTAKKKGTAEISASYKGKAASFRLVVKAKAKNPKLVLNMKSKTLSVGQTATIKVKKASGVTSKAVTYASKNESVATVSAKGRVTAKKAGSAYITARSKRNKKVVAKCKVTVKAAAAPASNSPDKPMTSADTVTPPSNDAPVNTGDLSENGVYDIGMPISIPDGSELYINGKSVDVTDGSYSFTEPGTYNVTIKDKEENSVTYTITVLSMDTGDFKDNGNYEVGESLSVPSDGRLFINGEPVHTVDGRYSFAKPGTYEVRIEKENGSFVTYTVTVECEHDWRGIYCAKCGIASENVSVSHSDSKTAIAALQGKSAAMKTTGLRSEVAVNGNGSYSVTITGQFNRGDGKPTGVAVIDVVYPADETNQNERVITIDSYEYLTTASVYRTEDGNDSISIASNATANVWLPFTVTYTVSRLPEGEHDWGSRVIDKPATCSEEGSSSIHCKNCDATKDAEVLPVTDHDYVNNICQNCDSVNADWSVCFTGQYGQDLSNSGLKDVAVATEKTSNNSYKITVSGMTSLSSGTNAPFYTINLQLTNALAPDKPFSIKSYDGKDGYGTTDTYINSVNGVSNARFDATASILNKTSQYSPAVSFSYSFVIEYL